MKHLIVQTLEKVSIVLAGLILLVGLIGGYMAYDVWTAILGLIFALAFCVFFFGILLIALEMNESLRAIRKQLEKTQP